jgi:large subunit ribosomal protein L7Ae
LQSSKRTGKGKKVAAPPRSSASLAKAASKKNDWKSQHGHLFPKKARSFGVGRDIQPKRNLSRFVKWPRYIRIQRQLAVLKQRIKTPPSVQHFTTTLSKNQAATVLSLLNKYRPESPAEKKQRLAARAEAEAAGKAPAASSKPLFVKSGLSHVTNLVEQRKAKLVVIAHDVDPIELVVWLPALCRKMDVPYVIIKGKGRLGHLVHQKKATAVALTEVRKEDAAALEKFIDNTRNMYNGAEPATLRKWGQRSLGLKTQAILRNREREAAKEARHGL